MRDAVGDYKADLVCRILKQMPVLVPVTPLELDARAWRADPLVRRLAQFWAATKQEVQAHATVVKTEEAEEDFEDTVAMPLLYRTTLSQGPSQLAAQSLEGACRPTDGPARRSHSRSRSPSPPPKRRCSGREEE
eukprot:TRINITY_DN4731_c0_g1_i1.p3 TRINITY_DN4731_c0_g1~~TRINITY_DN4731_c0_g1_i1.p3  ORF type:complete len:134 (+),score=13.33 TRINITY_DN4731_c0_g1_i1:708-1109(+)